MNLAHVMRDVKNIAQALEKLSKRLRRVEVLSRLAEVEQVDSFLDLTDTPDSYEGMYGWVPTINNLETGLEFTQPEGEGTWGEWGKIIRVGITTSDVQVYEPTEEGVATMIADCAAGHRVYFPRSITIAMTVAITIPVGVAFHTCHLSFSGFGGNAVTLLTDSAITDFDISFDATGEVTATAIYVSAGGCNLTRGNARCHDATTNYGYRLKGTGTGAGRVNAERIWANASFGTTAIAIKIEDDCRVLWALGEAHGAATKNVGIQFAIASLDYDDLCMTCWGLAVGVGYGIEVVPSSHAMIINGDASHSAGTAGLIVQSGATAHLYNVRTDSFVNLGSVNGLFYDGDNIQAADPIYTLEQAAPGVPPADWGAIYEKTDGKLYFKNDAGIEYDLTDSCCDLATTFGEIYVAAGVAAEAIPTGLAYTKLLAFTTDGESNNCTPDAANDKIVITELGIYSVNGSFSFASGTNAVEWQAACFLNGVEQTQIHWTFEAQQLGEVINANFTGFIDVATNADLDVRVRHDNVGPINITVSYANLNIHYLGPTAEVFAPGDLVGMQLWLKTDQGLYQDAAKTTPAINDTDPIGAWEDQSGNGNDAIQGVAGKRPLLKLNIVNGHQAVRFDGIDNFLDIASDFIDVDQDAWTIFAVAEISDTTHNNTIFDITEETAAQSILARLIYLTGAGDIRLQVRDEGSTTNTADFAENLAVFAGLMGSRAHKELKIDKNNTLEDTDNANNFGAFDAGNYYTTIGALRNGGVPAGSNFFEGDIVELIIYDSRLGETDRYNVFNYLANKYGLVIAPYAASPINIITSTNVETTDLEGEFTRNPAGVILPLGGVGEFDEDGIDNANLLRDSSNNEYMYYEGQDAATQELPGGATADNENLTSFTKFVGNPLLSFGGGGTFDEDAIKLPVIIEDGGTYYMIYTGRDGLAGPADVYRGGLALSANPDGGFAKYGGYPVAILTSTANSWQISVSPFCVFKINGTFYMIYRGGTNGSFENAKLGVATSADLITWVRSGLNPIIAGGTWEAFAAQIYVKDNVLHMLVHDATNDKYRIFRLNDADLEDWTEIGEATVDIGTPETISNPLRINGNTVCIIEVSGPPDNLYRNYI